VYEEGANKGDMGEYGAGDLFDVVINNKGRVAYRVNEQTRYTSTKVPRFPLVVDTAFNTAEGEAEEITWIVDERKYSKATASSNIAFGWFNGLSESEDGGLIKTRRSNGWDGGAVSQDEIVQGGRINGFEFTVNQNNKALFMGLATKADYNNQRMDFQTIDFAIYLQSNRHIAIYEKGSNRGNKGQYGAGDHFSIVINEDGMVEYKKDGDTFYTATNNMPTYPLVVDAAFQHMDAEVSEVKWVGDKNPVEIAHIQAGAKRHRKKGSLIKLRDEATRVHSDIDEQRLDAMLSDDYFVEDQTEGGIDQSAIVADV